MLDRQLHAKHKITRIRVPSTLLKICVINHILVYPEKTMFNRMGDF